MTNPNFLQHNQLRPCIWLVVGTLADYTTWRSECGHDKAYWPRDGVCSCGRKIEVKK